MGKIYTPNNIRNTVVIGHMSTGKTLLNDALLFSTKAIERKGEIERGTTTSDYTEEEILHKMSIHASSSFVEHGDTKINIIDTPGAGDFIGEVRPALRVAESAIVVIDAEFGIQIETEKKWYMANEFHRPRLIFVNKIDKDGIDFNSLIEKIETNFKEPPVVPIQIPIGSGKDFKGLIDIIHHKAYIYEGTEPKEVEIPDEYFKVYRETRDRLKELICEVDDSLTERFLAGEHFTDEEIMESLIKAILEYRVVPMLFGSALKDIGIKELLDVIVKYMPSPSFVAEAPGTIPTTGEKAKRTILGDDPFAAFVFKTSIDQYAGRVSFFKVRSGSISTHDEVYNSRTGKKEKVSHIYLARGKKHVEAEQITAGDIGVLAKLGDTKTSDSISCPKSPFAFHPLKLPQPIYFTAIKITKNDDKALEILDKIAQEDPAFHIDYDTETKETVIKAMGEVQVKLILEKVKTLAKAEIEKSVPTVAYRETIRSKSQAQYKHKKQSGGHGQFGEVHLEIEPLDRDGGFEFTNDIVGGAIPKQYIPGVEKGIAEAMKKGPLAKFPVVDFKVRLYDGKFHDVDSSELSFKIAGAMATRDAFKQANAVLLEPVMNVFVYVPDEYTGSVMNDLTGKRGKILGVDSLSNTTQQIKAEVPLSEMLTYSIDLKSLTSGRATFEMEHGHYQELTGALTEKVIESRKHIADIGDM